MLAHLHVADADIQRAVAAHDVAHLALRGADVLGLEEHVDVLGRHLHAVIQDVVHAELHDLRARGEVG